MRNFKEKPSGSDVELIFRLLIFFLTVLTSKKTLLIWFPPDLSGHGGIIKVSSFENTAKLVVQDGGHEGVVGYQINFML